MFQNIIDKNLKINFLNNSNCHAFEPESLNFACLNLNVSDNNLNKQIQTFPFAIDEEIKIAP